MTDLTKSQIDYIRDNYQKKSKRGIARDLGVDKHSVAKQINRLSKQTPAPEADGVKKIPSFLKRLDVTLSPNTRTLLGALAVFFIALLMRLIYLYQLRHTHFFTPFKGGYDDYIFDNWAQEILKGNWIGDKVIYIYRMPLYVYLLAGIYFLFGHSLWAAYIAQAFLGAAGCVLIFFIGKKLFGALAGTIAGVLSAFSGTFLFYTGMLTGETLGVFTACAAFLFLVYFQKSQKIYQLLFAGLFIGLSILTRGSMIIVLVFILPWVWSSVRAAGVLRRIACVAALLAATAAPIAPITVRNYICAKDFVPIAAQGGLNFYIANAYGSDGKYHMVDGVSSNPEDMLRSSIEVANKSVGRELKPSEVSRYWTGRTLQSIKEHGVLYLAPLTIKKLKLFWNSYDIPDIWDYYFFKEYIPLLGLPLMGFSFLAIFGALGIYLLWPRKKDAALLYLFVLGYMSSLLIFFVTARYRTQVVPFLCVFSAGAIVTLRDTGFLKKKALPAAVIVIGMSLFVSMPVKRVSFETSHNSLAILLKRSGDIKGAIDEYQRAIAIAPNYPSPYYNLGILYRDTGSLGQATTYFKKALELNPGFDSAREELERLK